MRELLSKMSKLGGIIAVVATIVSGGWFVAERLVLAGDVPTLKDDIRDIERRYNSHIEAEWKQRDVQEYKEWKRARQRSQRGDLTQPGTPPGASDAPAAREVEPVR